MPRNYVPDPRSKRHRLHDPKLIHEALSLISKGHSIRSVAKSSDIPYSCLQRYNNKKKN